jgi:hypothetical protein
MTSDITIDVGVGVVDLYFNSMKAFISGDQLLMTCVTAILLIIAEENFLMKGFEIVLEKIKSMQFLDIVLMRTIKLSK